VDVACELSAAKPAAAKLITVIMMRPIPSLETDLPESPSGSFDFMKLERLFDVNLDKHNSTGCKSTYNTRMSLITPG
jgi:hypothetical protein